MTNIKNQTIKLQLKNITKKYNQKDGVEHIDLDVYEGELITLLGPSGCGKTTILRLIGGFLQPDDGEIVLGGIDIQHIPPEKRPTAMVFQSYNLWPHMTVYDNLAFGLKLRKTPKSVIQEEIAKILRMMRMEGIEKKYPSQLSGGQQQRIAIARSLLLKPSILLLDEPFSALDAKIRAELRAELKRIQSELKITVLFVTHDQEEAMAISHRIVVMNKGSIEQIGTPLDIYDQPKTAFVAHFIGDMNFFEGDDPQSIIAIRPEDLKVRRDSEGVLQGRVTSIMPFGQLAEMEIETIKGNLKVSMPRRDAVDLALGKRVSLEITKKCIFPKGNLFG